jgi:hypothetical protein
MKVMLRLIYRDENMLSVSLLLLTPLDPISKSFISSVVFFRRSRAIALNSYIVIISESMGLVLSLGKCDKFLTMV